MAAASSASVLESGAGDVLALMDLSGSGGTFKAVGPEILIPMIIEGIIAVLNACRKTEPADLKAIAANPGILARLKVRRCCDAAVRAHLGGRFRLGAAEFNRASDELFDAVFGAAEAADVGRIAEVRKAALAA